jgi:hypothetical protein
MRLQQGQAPIWWRRSHSDAKSLLPPLPEINNARHAEEGCCSLSALRMRTGVTSEHPSCLVFQWVFRSTMRLSKETGHLTICTEPRAKATDFSMVPIASVLRFSPHGTCSAETGRIIQVTPPSGPTQTDIVLVLSEQYSSPLAKSMPHCRKCTASAIHLLAYARPDFECLRSLYWIMLSGNRYQNR